MVRYLLLAGGGFLFTSLAGKGFIRFYRHIKMAPDVGSMGTMLGKYYRGGFLGKMSAREASLILGVS